MAKLKRFSQDGDHWCSTLEPPGPEQLFLLFPSWLIFSMAGLALAALVYAWPNYSSVRIGLECQPKHADSLCHHPRGSFDLLSAGGALVNPRIPPRSARPPEC